MLFNSLAFAIFLPIVFAVYWIAPKRYGGGVILAASYYFYMSWSVKYAGLLFGLTIISYICGIMLEKYDKYRKFTVFCAAIFSMGILFVFKYFNFFSEIISDFASVFSINIQKTTLKLILPVGISFYTFQTLSYVIDVYRNRIKAERNFIVYAEFVSFFPQLVAGPIERAENLLPQFKKPKDFEYANAAYGLKLMAWGFFKKIVIADNFSQCVDRVYENITNFSGFSYVIAVLLFTIQIYCDFSGYSDIARGTAKLFNIELMKNFKSPYFSTSITEFWRRWHISLSRWLQDYLYIPLGGSRKGVLKKRINLIVTFLASGLWHGASGTFVLWGGIHGIYRVIEDIMGRKRKQEEMIKKQSVKWCFKVLVTFILVAAAWSLFRVNNMTDFTYMLMHCMDGIKSPMQYVMNGITCIALGPYYWIKVGFLLIILYLYDYFSLDYDVIECIGKCNVAARWAIYFAFVLLIICLGNFGQSPFIYFQF